MGRPSIYCVEIEDFIAEKLSIGIPKVRIAQALGIPKQTLESWLERKKSLQTKFANLRIQEVENRIKKVHATFWLERIEKENFAPPQHNLNISGDITVQTLLVEAKQKIDSAPGLDD